MRSLSFLAGFAALLLAGPLAAQTESAQPQPEQQAPAQPPAEQPAPAAPAPAAPAPAPAAAPATPIAAPQLSATPAITPENTWYLDLSTGGRVTIQLRPDAAPTHVERIRALTRQGFYNGLTFHRVIEGFMAQGGDPTGSGIGGSQLPNVNAEISGLPHVRGAVGMARAQELNSANSQFFIMFTPRLQMDREYTILGRVVGGMNFVDAIERGEPPAAPTPDRPRLDRIGQYRAADHRRAHRRRDAVDGARRRCPGRSDRRRPGDAAPGGGAAPSRAGPGTGPAEAARAVRKRPKVRVDAFDFDLPPDRIALRPAAPRDSARLLTVTGGADRRSSCQRFAAPASRRRRAGVQRYKGHPGPAGRAPW